MTVQSVATTTNPSHFPSRYEIRRLQTKHIPWACAIVSHSNCFYSPVWSRIYTVDQCSLNLRLFDGGDYVCRHQIESGYSFGVFDLEYQYKRPESVATEGALYWDPSDPSEKTADQLLDEMDFPLVSIALAYDGINPLDMTKLAEIMTIVPLFKTMYQTLEIRDPRPPESWKATAPRQVLMRNATSTRADAESKGLMRRLAQWLMRHAAEQGFRGIQIECAHDRVHEVWSRPPSPFKGTVVSDFDTQTYEEEEMGGEDGKTPTGKMVRPFAPSALRRVTKVYVDLTPGHNKENGVAVANGVCE